jgi:TetR/AcrR family transcriptional regulator, ethionamide resistance regulator
MTSSSRPAGTRRSGPIDQRHIEHKKLTARHMLPAVERLLEDETYPELTVEQIVAEAGISRSKFYNYFEDKEELLRALAEDVMGAILDASRTWWMLPPDATKEDLFEALRHLFEVYSPHSTLMLAVAESSSHDSRVREKFLQIMEYGVVGVTDYIRAGQRAGELEPDIDALPAAQWLTWMFERGLSHLSRSPAEYEPERVVRAASDILWKALH